MSEEEIALDINVDSPSPPPNSLSSSLDREREEVLWETRNQDLLKKWGVECKTLCKQHKTKAKKNKRMYVIVALPCMIIPITSSIIQPHIQNQFVLSILMLITGVLSTVNTFFNFSAKREKHNEADRLYEELSLGIDEILATKKKHRQAADITLRTTLLKLNHISSISPPL